jgi:hypothetical protein
MGGYMRLPEKRYKDLPAMRVIRQRYFVPQAIDPVEAMEKEWESLRQKIALKAGLSVAVAVGSRGITGLAAVVADVVRRLKEASMKPFITPAMGSHGGATAEGQKEVLRLRGITEETVGAPVKATMEVVSMGEADGIPLFLDRLAYEADAIVLVNRVKPHTNFIGPTESGLIKMIAIGLGNQKGAEHYHRLSVVKDQYKIISTAGKELIKRSRVLFGVGLVENQDHKTCMIRAAAADEIETVESELLKAARACLPLIPIDEVDLLIIDEMGKDISGEGIDPNVVGRDVCAYGAKRHLPSVTRIFVRDLTPGSEGSALGIGQADFTLKRLVDKIDFKVTAINCLTACCPESGKIPLAYETDREAIEAVLMTLRPYTLDDLRIVHIKNTLELNTLWASDGCLADLHGRSDVEVSQEKVFLSFDSSGNLISPFSA